MYILQLHEALEAWEQDAIEQLLASSVMHVDETSMRLDAGIGATSTEL